MGLITYYSRFIKDLATLAKPLYAMMAKNKNFNWDDKCEQIFQRLKEIMSEKPVLKAFDPEQPVFLYTDASSVGFGYHHGPAQRRH